MSDQQTPEDGVPSKGLVPQQMGRREFLRMAGDLDVVHLSSIGTAPLLIHGMGEDRNRVGGVAILQVNGKTLEDPTAGGDFAKDEVSGYVAISMHQLPSLITLLSAVFDCLNTHQPSPQ